MLNLNQQFKRVEIKEFEIENQIVFNYFDNLPASEPEVFQKIKLEILFVK